MNPVRSLAPALITGDTGNVWIYVVGPLIGAVLAVVVTRVIHGSARGQCPGRRRGQGHR